MTFCPENENCMSGPGGMYHCPYCGEMILPGFSTEGLCGMENGFDIGQAIQLMKAGFRVARHGWNGKDMWLSYTPGREVPSDNLWSSSNKKFAEESGGSVEVLPAITMKNAKGQVVMGWLAYQEDLLAEDWFLVVDVKTTD